MRTLSTRRRRTRDRGQGLTEFALVIPVFLLVMFAIFDFGFMLYSRLTVMNAALEGARAGVMLGDASTIPVVVESTVKSVSFALTTSSPTMTITSTCVTIKTTPGPCNFTAGANSRPGDAVQVTVTYQYRTFFPLLFGATMNMSSTVQMVLE